MTKRSILAAVVSTLSWIQVASAQSAFNPLPPTQPTPYRSTTVLSPYLNLLNGGNPAVNYYNGVLPEMWRRDIVTRGPLALDLGRYDPFVDDRVNLDVLEKQLPPTGHPSGFMIYNAYYNLPNQRSFIPYNPQPRMQGQGQGQPQMPIR